MIVDLDQRVIAVLAGRPSNWQIVHDEAIKAIQVAAAETTTLCSKCQDKPWTEWCEKTCANRRGSYRFISYGLSHGNGHSVSAL